MQFGVKALPHGAEFVARAGDIFLELTDNILERFDISFFIYDLGGFENIAPASYVSA